MKKLLYLFLALLLPALIFLFLKYQGKNKFDIPVYYQDSVEGPDDCGSQYTSPYRVRLAEFDSTWTPATATVVIFPKTGTEPRKIMAALDEELGTENLRMIEACKIVTDSLACAQWKKCFFLVKEPWHSVLIDREGAIRGYYDLSLREEVDKLRVELKILLEKY